jgi:hypothetical protein
MLRAHLNRYVEEGLITSWSVPEDYTFVDELSKTSVGQIDKKVLRSRFGVACSLSATNVTAHGGNSSAPWFLLGSGEKKRGWRRAAKPPAAIPAPFMAPRAISAAGGAGSRLPPSRSARR